MLLLIVTAIVLMIAFGEAHARWIPLSGLPAWAALLLLHAILSGILLWLVPSIRNAMKVTIASLVFCVPAFAVLVLSYVLTVVAPTPGPTREASLGYLIASCSLIPLVEEIVFRGGVSRVLMRPQAGVWGAYLSALVFSVVHTTPSLERVISWQVGAPLGPFFLGLICEVLVRHSGSLIPAVAFHCACNATVLIFNTWSPGWFDRLALLYQ